MIIQIINLLTFNKEKEKRDILNILATKVGITRNSRSKRKFDYENTKIILKHDEQNN